jgi:nicotinate-nucleotide pyrophosphorylase (carboxylating)
VTDPAPPGDAGGLHDIDRDAADLARRALAEDGARDITTLVTTPPGIDAEGVLEVRSHTVLAGTRYADAVLAACGLPKAAWRFRDGERLPKGSVAATLSGSLREILLAERTLLNMLQRACGIATMTRRYVDAVAHTSARILHTRKTAPGLRTFDVAAVLAGGGGAHRLDLERAVMIKDNHWRALARTGRTLGQALAQAREQGVEELYVEVESLAQVEEGCAARATRLLIDNQAPATVANWGARARALRTGIEIEATGGITLENVARYAQAAADFISIGALTHSVVAADISLELRER